MNQIRNRSMATASAKSWRYPAEWEPQQAVWFGWPVRDCQVVDGRSTIDCFIDIFTEITQYCFVKVMTRSEEEKEDATRILRSKLSQNSMEKVIFYGGIDFSDNWFRDCGPIFMVTGDRRRAKVLNFEWTAWDYIFHVSSSLRSSMVKDSCVACAAAALGKLAVESISLVSEGGNREFNGDGVLLASKIVECSRNPSLTLLEIEKRLMDAFNLKKVIWVGVGPAEDQSAWKGLLSKDGIYPTFGTGGHIDEIARFVSSDTIVVGWITEEEAKHSDIASRSRLAFMDAYDIISKSTDANGKPFHVIKLPCPTPIVVEVAQGDEMYEGLKMVHFDDGHRIDDEKRKIRMVIACSYMNFLITNGLVLVSKYYKPGRDKSLQYSDNEAAKILQECFPSRKVVSVDVDAINVRGGGMHCQSQQEPVFEAVL